MGSGGGGGGGGGEAAAPIYYAAAKQPQQMFSRRQMGGDRSVQPMLGSFSTSGAPFTGSLLGTSGVAAPLSQGYGSRLLGG